MPHVAFMTYGEIHEARGHPRVAEFYARAADAFAQARAADGHIATADERDPAWGPHRFADIPDDATPPEARHRVQTLSVWRDLDAVAAFAYSGSHRASLGKRREWFRKIAAPVYVAWWVADDHTPSWDEACERLEHLHAHGPTAYAFTFRHAFGPDGEPTEVARPRK